MSKRFIDTFVGCGGFSEGLRQAGLTPICGVDIDKAALKTYAANFKNAKVIQGDVGSNQTIDALKRIKGSKPLYAVVGGPPCQPYSTLNVHKNMDDTRRDLPMAFVNVCAALDPKYVVMEEVVAFIKGGHRQRVLDGLARAGYKYITENVINAADCGAPTLRKRYIMIACKNQSDLPRNWPPKPLHPKKSVAHALRENRPLGSPADARPHPKPIIAATQTKIMVKMRHPSKSPYFSQSYGVMDLSKPAMTLTTQCSHPSTGRFTIQTANGGFRRLSVHEAKVIQGFPSNFYFMKPEGPLNTLYQAYKQIGNSVSPAMSRAIGNALR